MSKQSDAKAAQGYEPKPLMPICGNCKNHTPVVGLPKWERERNARSVANGEKPRYGKYHEQVLSNRCDLGGFAVLKSATCKQYKPKT